MKKEKKMASLTLGIIIVLFFPVAIQAQTYGGSSQNPLAGSRVFGSKGCSQCHAVNGVGGKIAADLGRIPKPHTFYDLASAMWNHLPEMIVQMRKLKKPLPQLSPRETGDLIAFLATINYFDPVGDSKAGKKIFVDKQCVGWVVCLDPALTPSSNLARYFSRPPCGIMVRQWTRPCKRAVSRDPCLLAASSET